MEVCLSVLLYVHTAYLKADNKNCSESKNTGGAVSEQAAQSSGCSGLIWLDAQAGRRVTKAGPGGLKRRALGPV